MEVCEGEKMVFFVIEVNENYTAPSLVGWYGIIDKKTLSRKKVYQLPKHLLFTVEKHMQMVFTDVITVPCFMVSEMVRDIIKRYDPSVWFLRIILYDKECKRSMAYFIPYLKQIKYKEQIDAEIRSLRHLSVQKEDIEEKVIVEIENGFNFKVIMRMDLVESILRREAVGIGLRKIDIL